jgi:hypothetical protein
MKKAKGKNNQNIISFFLRKQLSNRLLPVMHRAPSLPAMYRAHRFRLCRLMRGKASPFRSVVSNGGCASIFEAEA